MKFDEMFWKDMLHYAVILVVLGYLMSNHIIFVNVWIDSFVEFVLLDKLMHKLLGLK